MVTDADDPSPQSLPNSWRWPSQWPAWAQVALVLLVWMSSLLSHRVDPVWEHIGYALVTTYFVWAGWDVLANPSNPYMAGRGRARRVTHALVGLAVWIGLTTWYVWSLLAAG